MIYSPHTLELTLIPDTKRFNKLRDKAYKNSKGSHKMHPDKKRIGVCLDHALKDNGITVEYHDGTYKKRIKLIVNPTKILGGNDIKKLWKPSRDNISKFLDKLKNHTDDYFSSKYKLNDFTLTRIDFTVNINMDDNKTVAAYIKILRSIGKVKGFAPKFDDSDDRIIKELSFDLKGNSNDLEFTAYDKEIASSKKEAKGILRIEVRLMKQKAIKRFTDASDTSKQIKSLALSSKDIFLSTFMHVVPRGDYYKKADAMKIIKEGVVKETTKKKMLKLLEFIPKKKSLYLAQKEMGDRNIDKIMAMFAEINVSPITITKRHNIKHLKSLYSYLI